MKNILMVVLIIVTIASLGYAFLQDTAALAARKYARLEGDAAASSMAEAEKALTYFREQNMKLRDSLKNCKGR